MSVPSLPADQPLQATAGQYGLAMHTSSPDLGLAITDLAGNIRAQTWDLGRSLSTHLHIHLAEFLQPQVWTDLAFIAVAKGPGGFTGTRLGVVTARTLAQQLALPLFGISSLATLAQAYLTEKNITSKALEGVQAAIAIQMPAHRGEVFGAIYQPTNVGLQPLMPDAVMTQAQWQQVLEQWQTPLHLVTTAEELEQITLSLLQLALFDWHQGQRPNWAEVLPFYGQHPVAES